MISRTINIKRFAEHSGGGKCSGYSNMMLIFSNLGQNRETDHADCVSVLRKLVARDPPAREALPSAPLWGGEAGTTAMWSLGSHDCQGQRGFSKTCLWQHGPPGAREVQGAPQKSEPTSVF